MNKIAVFFDAENVSPKIVPDIMAELSSKGDILFQRAYADWSIGNTKGWQEQIRKTPITVYQQFHNGEAQVIDKAIMMDAVELAIKHDEITIIAISSSDNGYYSLALRLRELGKQVIGLGEKGKCNPIWINACNEFIYFSDLKQIDEKILLENEEIKENKGLADYSLLKFLEQAYDSTQTIDDKDIVLVSRLGETILRFKPDFKYSDYGKRNLRDLLSDYTDVFTITDDGKKQPTHFVQRNEKKQNLNSKNRQKGEIDRWIQRYGIIKDDNKNEYFFYAKEILSSSKQKKPRKGSKVEFLITKEPNLSADSTKERNGYATDIEILD